MSVSCTGDCDPQGWIPRGSHIDTGYSSGTSMVSLMTIPNISIPQQGSFQLYYSLASWSRSHFLSTCPLSSLFVSHQHVLIRSGTSACSLFLILDSGLEDGAIYVRICPLLPPAGDPKVTLRFSSLSGPA